jgi:hypothetical protein
LAAGKQENEREARGGVQAADAAAASILVAERVGLSGVRDVHPPPFRPAESVADPGRSNRYLQYDGKTMICSNRIVRQDRLLITTRREEAASKDSV